MRIEGLEMERGWPGVSAIGVKAVGLGTVGAGGGSGMPWRWRCTQVKADTPTELGEMTRQMKQGDGD